MCHVVLDILWTHEQLLMMSFHSIHGGGRKIGHKIIYEYFPKTRIDSSWMAWNQALHILGCEKKRHLLYDPWDLDTPEHSTVLHKVSCNLSSRTSWERPIIRDKYLDSKAEPKQRMQKEEPQKEPQKKREKSWIPSEESSEGIHPPHSSEDFHKGIEDKTTNFEDACDYYSPSKSEDEIPVAIAEPELSPSRNIFSEGSVPWTKLLDIDAYMTTEEKTYYKFEECKFPQASRFTSGYFSQTQISMFPRILQCSFSSREFPESSICPFPDVGLSNNYGTQPKCVRMFQPLRRWNSEYFLENGETNVNVSHKRHLLRNASLSDAGRYKVNCDRKCEENCLDFILLGDMGIGSSVLPDDMTTKREGYDYKIDIRSRSISNHENQCGLPSKVTCNTDLRDILKSTPLSESLPMPDSHESFDKLLWDVKKKSKDMYGIPFRRPLSSRALVSKRTKKPSLIIETDIKKCRIGELVPITVALQITKMECQLFLAVTSEELVLLMARPHLVDTDLCPNLWRLFQFSGRISHLVTTEILNKIYARQGTAILAFFVEILKLCYDMQNFQSTRSILLGILSPPLVCLSKMWKEFNKGYPDYFRILNQIYNEMQMTGFHPQSSKPCIPEMENLVIYLRQNLWVLFHNLTPQQGAGVYAKLQEVVSPRNSTFKKLFCIIKLMSFKSRKKENKSKENTSSDVKTLDLNNESDNNHQSIRTGYQILKDIIQNVLTNLQSTIKDDAIQENNMARLYLLRNLYRLPHKNMKVSQEINFKFDTLSY